MEWKEIQEDIERNGGINPIGEPIHEECHDRGRELLYVCNKSYEQGKSDALYTARAAIRLIFKEEFADTMIGLFEEALKKLSSGDNICVDNNCPPMT